VTARQAARALTPHPRHAPRDLEILIETARAPQRRVAAGKANRANFRIASALTAGCQPHPAAPRWPG